MGDDLCLWVKQFSFLSKYHQSSALMLLIQVSELMPLINKGVVNETLVLNIEIFNPISHS